jgi:hypothetical protein
MNGVIKSEQGKGVGTSRDVRGRETNHVAYGALLGHVCTFNLWIKHRDSRGLSTHR